MNFKKIGMQNMFLTYLSQEAMATLDKEYEYVSKGWFGKNNQKYELGSAYDPSEFRQGTEFTCESWIDKEDGKKNGDCFMMKSFEEKMKKENESKEEETLHENDSE